MRNPAKRVFGFILRRSFLRFPFDLIEILMNRLSKDRSREKSGWSIVIVTSGRSNAELSDCLKSIFLEFQSVPYEVLIVGPRRELAGFRSNPTVRIVPYWSFDFLPGMIGHKKNIGASRATFDKLIICHDYIKFLGGFVAGVESFGDDFSILMTKVSFQDGRRARDWLAWDLPGVGPGLLPYDVLSCSRYMYVSGTYFIAKRSFFLKNGFDPFLRWGEGEDVEWSVRVRKYIVFKLCTNAEVQYLREKSPNDAPYCESWLASAKSLEKVSRLLSEY